MSVLPILDKPDYCYSSGCPLARCKNCDLSLAEHVGGKCTDGKTFESKGKGFVAGSGDPYSAKYMFILEAPGKQEISFFLFPVASRGFFSTPEECNAEVARRKKAYPEVDEKFLRKGAPIVGDSGVELDMWVLPAVGIQRKEVFIDNTLRCLPPKVKERSYPVGDDRKEAEKCCRHWDRLHQFRPNVMVITMHPAGILREVTPLPLQVKDFEKARDFRLQGLRPAILIGGMSAKAYLRYGENVTKFRGDYRVLPANYLATYKDKFTYVSKSEKKRRAKIVSATEALFDLTPGINPGKVERKKKAKKEGGDVKRNNARKKKHDGASGEGNGDGGLGSSVSDGAAVKAPSRKRTRRSAGVPEGKGDGAVAVRGPEGETLSSRLRAIHKATGVGGEGGPDERKTGS